MKETNAKISASSSRATSIMLATSVVNGSQFEDRVVVVEGCGVNFGRRHALADRFTAAWSLACIMHKHVMSDPSRQYLGDLTHDDIRAIEEHLSEVFPITDDEIIF